MSDANRNHPVLHLTITTIGALVGGVFAQFILPPLVGRLTNSEIAREFAVTSAGIIAGALLFSWASKH